MASAWITLCKKIQQRDQCTYKEAMTRASIEYKQKRGGSIKSTMMKELGDLIEKTTDEKSKKNLQKQKKNLESLKEGGNLKHALSYITTKRDASVLPKSVRQNLIKYGQEKITSIIIVRTPLEKAINGLLSVISVNKYKKAIREAGYDRMFHLALYINNKYLIDKQAVVTFQVKNPIKKNSEKVSIPIKKPITMQELIENTKKYMGDSKFSGYDAFKNNCQDFILGVLSGNNIAISPSTRQFIKQDAEAVLQKLPKFSVKIAKFLTDAGAVADKVIHGSGNK